MLTRPQVSHTVRSMPALRTMMVVGWSQCALRDLALLANIWKASLANESG